MDDRLQIGCVVYSKKGRDSGSYFLVVKIEGDIVYISDGDKRKLAHPKKKNIKHIKSNGQILETIAQKMISGKKVFDSEIKSALREYNEVNGGNDVEG